MLFESFRSRRDMFDAIDDVAASTGLDFRRMLSDPERIANARRAIEHKGFNDPIVKRFATGGHSQLGVRIRDPWMALAEQRMFAAAIASNEFPCTIWDGDDSYSNDAKRAQLASVLWCSQTYLWSKSVFDTVIACPMPAHVVSRDILPFPFTYHSYEVAYDIHQVSGGPDLAIPNDALSDWMHASYIAPDGCSVAHAVSSEKDYRNGLTIVRTGLQFGKRYPDDYPGYARAPLGVFLSMFAFLQSEYVSLEKRRLPRQWRRGKTAIVKPGSDPIVNVVQLRREAREAVEAYAAESKSFKHRWWVSGHFRAQFYPSTNSHQVVWIAPYLKGPDNAPMLNKVYSVQR